MVFKVIALSSVRPGEGKSTTSLTNIAWAFARAGYKTPPIDADIAIWSCQVSLNLEKKITGLTDYLSGNQRFIAWFV